MKDPYKVIIKPYITEKTMRMKENSNTLAFHVFPGANKIDIRNAVETLFDVKVKKVRTLHMKGKVKRLGVNQGKKPDWKKAFVTLAEGYTIDFFEGL